MNRTQPQQLGSLPQHAKHHWVFKIIVDWPFPGRRLQSGCFCCNIIVNVALGPFACLLLCCLICVIFSWQSFIVWAHKLCSDKLHDYPHKHCHYCWLCSPLGWMEASIIRFGCPSASVPGTSKWDRAILLLLLTWEISFLYLETFVFNLHCWSKWCMMGCFNYM